MNKYRIEPALIGRSIKSYSLQSPSNIQIGIIRADVSCGRMEIIAQKALVYDQKAIKPVEVLAGPSGLQERCDLLDDNSAHILPNAFGISAFPMLGRISGEITEDGGVIVEWRGQQRKLPARCFKGPVFTGLISEYETIRLEERDSSAELTGKAFVGSDFWFSDFEVTNHVMLKNGMLTRSVTAQNVGDCKAPLGFAETANFNVPEIQDLKDVCVHIPAHHLINTAPRGVIGPVEGPIVSEVKNSRLSGLFRGEIFERRLGKCPDISISAWFTFLRADEKAGRNVFGTFYDDDRWGASLSSPLGSDAKALQFRVSTYKGEKVASFTLSSFLPDPFNPEWIRRFGRKEIPRDKEHSGMTVLLPGQSAKWQVRYSIFDPMILT